MQRFELFFEIMNLINNIQANKSSDKFITYINELDLMLLILGFNNVKCAQVDL